MGEARNKVVEMYSQSGFWKFNQKGVTGRPCVSWRCWWGSEAGIRGRNIRRGVKKQRPHRPACNVKTKQILCFSLIVGDSNNVGSFQFHRIEERRMWCQGISPYGRSRLHWARGKGLVGWVALIFQGKTLIGGGCPICGRLWRSALLCDQLRKGHGWWWGTEVQETEPLLVASQGNRQMGLFDDPSRVTGWDNEVFQNWRTCSIYQTITSRSAESDTAAVFLAK